MKHSSLVQYEDEVRTFVNDVVLRERDPMPVQHTTHGIP